MITILVVIGNTGNISVVSHSPCQTHNITVCRATGIWSFITLNATSRVCRSIDVQPPSRSSKERRLLRLAGKLKAIEESKPEPEPKPRPSSRRGIDYAKASVFDRLACAETFASASSKCKANRPSSFSWSKPQTKRRISQTLKCNHYVIECDIVARCYSHVFGCPICCYRVKDLCLRSCGSCTML